MLCFLALLYSAFRALRRVDRLGRRLPGSAPPAALAQALIATLLAYCIGGFFLSQAYSPLLYAVLGMIVGLVKVARAWARTATAGPFATGGRAA